VWSIRSNDGGMNGLEFCRCTTAGGFARVLVHATPAKAGVEITGQDGEVIVRCDVEREGDYSPMTLLEVGGGGIKRTEVWPDDSMYGLPVLLAGGEAGILRSWENDPERTWWRWTLELSNHRSRPPDWSPEREGCGTEIQVSTTAFAAGGADAPPRTKDRSKIPVQPREI
jgi:hypothetical protein